MTKLKIVIILEKFIENKARELVISGGKIEAIKFVHHSTSASLKQAKYYIDVLDLEHSLRDILGNMKIKELSTTLLEIKISELVALGRRVYAIKLLYIVKDMSLSDADKYIDTI